jgi:hypothetical protein
LAALLAKGVGGGGIARRVPKTGRLNKTVELDDFLSITLDYAPATRFNTAAPEWAGRLIEKSYHFGKIPMSNELHTGGLAAFLDAKPLTPTNPFAGVCVVADFVCCDAMEWLSGDLRPLGAKRRPAEEDEEKGKGKEKGKDKEEKEDDDEDAPDEDLEGEEELEEDEEEEELEEDEEFEDDEEFDEEDEDEEEDEEDEEEEDEEEFDNPDEDDDYDDDDEEEEFDDDE